MIVTIKTLGLMTDEQLNELFGAVQLERARRAGEKVIASYAGWPWRAPKASDLVDPLDEELSPGKTIREDYEEYMKRQGRYTDDCPAPQCKAIPPEYPQQGEHGFNPMVDIKFTVDKALHDNTYEALINDKEFQARAREAIKYILEFKKSKQ